VWRGDGHYGRVEAMDWADEHDNIDYIFAPTRSGHTAAYWLMHRVRAAIPPAHPLARAEFATIRERLIKIAARVIEHVARIRIQLPTSCPEGALFRTVALGLMQSGP
jgi:hypothetical protein